jgi:DNA-binding transcriptional MocR family regulator
MTAAIASYFPQETRTSKPVGGCVMWLELPEAVDSEKLFDRAIQEGISIAPGSIFSPCNRYRNFIRLSFGHPWTAEIEDGLKRLGQTVKELATRTH